MNKIEIYIKHTCGFCMRAKALLDHFGYPYTEYEISLDTHKRQEMIGRSGRYTVPQIFINDQSVGGSEELIQLFKNGELENLVSDKTVKSVAQQEELKNVA